VLYVHDVRPLLLDQELELPLRPGVGARQLVVGRHGALEQSHRDALDRRVADLRVPGDARRRQDANTVAGACQLVGEPGGEQLGASAPVGRVAVSDEEDVHGQPVVEAPGARPPSLPRSAASSAASNSRSAKQVAP